VARYLQFLLAVLSLATVLLAGCGGQETSVEEQEEEAGVEEVAPEAPVESLPSYDPEANRDLEICQVEEVLEDLGPEDGQRFTDELLGEVSAGEFANMQEAYAARGYTCDGRAEELLER